jgi:hypothetical protein
MRPFSLSSILLYSLLFHSISTCSYSASTLFNYHTRIFFSSSLLSYYYSKVDSYFFFSSSFYSFISVYVVTIDIRYFICRSSLFIDKRVKGKKKNENTTRRACSAGFCQVDDKRIVTYTER